ncbi:iron-containing redox enzyme family protein [Gordonia sp. CPCC 206044]|uniref:iron-containing redox enzyme family protein n=1 Tax=Gordonia sp. CPCC 206044 TaxID=3140793 RepID=UPI003AF3AED2
MRSAHTRSAAELPSARGPLSDQVIARLTQGSGGNSLEVADADPFDDDTQLALYVCYELHYRGFVDVDDEHEWDPVLLTFRRELERRFMGAVRDSVGALPTTVSADDEMAELSVEPIDGEGLSYELRDNGTWEQFRDLFALRSLYHHKEADPHAWAIPRLRHQAKAAFVAVEFDEFGAGRGDAVHQELFTDLMGAAGLRTDYLAYLDDAPWWALAPVNLMSCFGLHRSLRGATVGHLAATEITSPPGSQRLLAGLERLDAPESCRHFYREHVEADAVHEQILRTDVVGSLILDEPALERDIVFGMRAFLAMEDAFGEGLRGSWIEGIPAMA